MSKFKVGDKVVVLNPVNSFGLYKEGDTGTITLMYDWEEVEEGYDVRFDHLDSDGSEIEFYVSIREISSIKSKKKGKEMKNVQEVKFPLYAVVNTATNFVYDISLNREDARSSLQAVKAVREESGKKGSEVEIIKMTSGKRIR